MGGRLRFPALIVAAVMLLVPNCVLGQIEEQKAYCAYVMQQALAQRNLLRTPEAVAGISHANIGIPPQLYFGISEGVANYGKAKRTMEAARKDCESYRATAEATLHVQYALPMLERDALRHRTDSIGQAIEQMDVIINRALKVVEVQNLTRPALYSIRSIRAKLVADRTSTELKLALLHVPDSVSNIPLKQLVLEKETRESEAQRSIALANRPNSWDLKLEAGGRQRVSVLFENPVVAYGGVAFNYNFGSRSNYRHLDVAAAEYADWKKAQNGEVTHSARALEQQILRIISVDEAELRALREQETEIDSNLQRLVGVDTASAIGFGNQLDSDRVVLQVEIRDVTFRLRALQAYLKNNF
jgi:hypothetical protein